MQTRSLGSMEKLTCSSRRGPPTLKSTFWKLIKDIQQFYREGGLKRG
jgi:hypothetical protein